MSPDRIMLQTHPGHSLVYLALALYYLSADPFAAAAYATLAGSLILHRSGRPARPTSAQGAST